MGGGLSRWRAVGASVVGAGHIARGDPCQDVHRVAMLGNETLIVAVADGAGSAPLSADGAALAADASVDALMLALAATPPCAYDDDDNWHRLLQRSLGAARYAVESRAHESAAALGDFASTLLVVAAVPGVVACAQVGDGAVVMDRGARLEVVGADAKGEYINETTFVSSDSWFDEARLDVVHDPDNAVDGLALMTDGLQLLALDLAAGTPHAPFFDPLFSFARSTGAKRDELAAFLSSDRVRERTDDDVTVVLAVRG